VQLQQVMLNLMMNAIESMVGEKRGYRELHVASEKDDAQVMLTVRDTGHGFDPDARDRIFEAFFTTKAHGMGMGLAISRSIVETHGGRLWATESEIRGSAFRFTIPTA
jgi:signal transduction histidine kinase